MKNAKGVSHLFFVRKGCSITSNRFLRISISRLTKLDRDVYMNASCFFATSNSAFYANNFNTIPAFFDCQFFELQFFQDLFRLAYCDQMLVVVRQSIECIQ